MAKTKESKKEVKETKKAPAKANAKAAEAAPAEMQAQTQEQKDELEEQADAAAATSGGGNAEAMAAATGQTEMSASFKNFRHHPDMENFYRFINDNDLRHEALGIIDEILLEKHNRKAVKMAKAQAH